MRNREYKLNCDNITSIEDIKNIFKTLDLSVNTTGEDKLYLAIKGSNKEKELFKLVGEDNA